MEITQSISVRPRTWVGLSAAGRVTFMNLRIDRVAVKSRHRVDVGISRAATTHADVGSAKALFPRAEPVGARCEQGPANREHDVLLGGAAQRRAEQSFRCTHIP